MRRVCLAVLVLAALVQGGFCQESSSHSDELIGTTLIPKETLDTETLSLSIPNRLVLNNFNIFINPAQIMVWGTVYGEVLNETGTEWGGATFAVPFGKLGVFIGRPYNGSVALTGTKPGTVVAATPAGLSALPLGQDPTGAANSIYNLSTLGVGSNQVDLMYGMNLRDNLTFGLDLSLASNSDEKNYSYSAAPANVNSAGEGSISNKQSSIDTGISLGLLFKDLGPMNLLDVALGISMPKISNEFNETAYTSAISYGRALDKVVSDNGNNFDLLIRAVIPKGENTIVAALKTESVDVSVKRTLQADDDATTPTVDRTNRAINFSDKGNSTNLDVALHTQPNDKLKVIYSAGIANFSRDIDVLENGLSIGGAVAPGKDAEETAKYHAAGFPIAVSLEHQTWAKVATRFSASTVLFSDANNDFANILFYDASAPLDGVNDTVLVDVVTKEKISPRKQTATVGLGLGVKPVEKVTVDVALKANIFDLDAGAGVAEIISRVSMKYSF